MPGYEAEIADFERYDAQVVGISVDSVPSHVAFAKSLGNIEKYPLLADFHPKGEVARRYGVYDDGVGMSERALFVVDGGGVIQWSYVSPVGVNPGADGVLSALESLTRKEVEA